MPWGRMTSVPATAPARVRGITNAVAMSTSPYASCAVLEDGTVWCWGSNAGLSLGQPASVGFSSGAYAVPGVW